MIIYGLAMVMGLLGGFIIMNYIRYVRQSNRNKDYL